MLKVKSIFFFAGTVSVISSELPRAPLNPVCLSSTEMCVCKLIETRLYSAASSSVRCVEFVVYVVYTGNCSWLQARFDKFLFIACYIRIKTVPLKAISEFYKHVWNLENWLFSTVDSLHKSYLSIFDTEKQFGNYQKILTFQARNW